LGNYISSWLFGGIRRGQEYLRKGLKSYAILKFKIPTGLDFDWKDNIWYQALEIIFLLSKPKKKSK